MSSLQILEARIKDELENLKKLLSEAEAIIEKKASNINIRAGGSILHDFYTGIERIFESIAGTIDMEVPTGMNWHIELLNQMTLKIPDLRSQIIKKDTAKMLEEFLRFRHLFRKRYGFDLEWLQIKRLLKKMPLVYAALVRDIHDAFEFTNND